ncbi:uncharacterized protein LOC131212311 [Anopheles bellator]|uniref:uncharacterized protein LOC131212311 n=1 Tax=Anopheles bellator TaxID=139047 RepID=UPI002648DD06|nr:uncharacterized protein LOC131212311 [Anopheles bellator]
MYVWIKSAAYLVVFGGLGYVLLELTKPSEEKLKQLRYSTNAEEKSKKALFMKKLEEASKDEPIYLKKKSDQ